MTKMKTVYLGGLRTEAEHLQSGNKLITDAPLDNNGKGEFFSPTDLLATSLGSCMLTIMGISAPAYGYNLVNGEMVINEDEAKVVRRIFELYLSGKGLQAIAGIMNEEQVPRRYGRTHWHHNTIRYILTNERYKGDALLQKKYTTDTLPYRLKLNKGEKTQYYLAVQP